MERQALIDACVARVKDPPARDYVAKFGGFDDFHKDLGWSSSTMCHSAISGLPYKGGIYSASQTMRLGYDREAALAFYAWAFGAEGPYRNYLYDDVPHDPEFLVDKGLVIVDTDKIPANLLYNMVIAWRFPTEYPWVVVEWKRRVDLGVHPALAYLFIYVPPGRANPNSNHQGFDWKRISEEYVTNFMNGTPKENNLTAVYSAAKTSCFPCNAVWGDKNVGGMSGDSVVGEHQFLPGWCDRYPELAPGVQAVELDRGDPWGSKLITLPYKKPTIRSVDNLIEILKLEGARLAG